MKKGFTLIELLVVVAIIGLLSSVVISSLNVARSRGRDAQRQENIRQMQIALDLYRDTNGTYPVLGWSHSTGGSNWNSLVSQLAPFLDVPIDPLNTGLGYTNDQYGYSYYASGYGGSGKWYMLVWELENPNSSVENTDGVTACDGRLFHYGSGTNGIVTTGGSC